MTKADIVNEIAKTTGIEKANGKNSPQHLQEHHHHHPRTQDSRIQAGKSVHGRGEIRYRILKRTSFRLTGRKHIQKQNINNF